MDILLSEEIDAEYLRDVKCILMNKEFLSLGQFTHHYWTTRLMHSINVSYISWHLAKKFGCNATMAARAGLLHDFCPYDFKEKTPTGEKQTYYHPKAAAKNSEMIFGISELERDAILSHMFPFGPLPKSKEAWIVTLADKICASMEVCHVTIALAREGRVVVTQV